MNVRPFKVALQTEQERTPFEDAPYQFLSNSEQFEFLAPTRAPAGVHLQKILLFSESTSFRDTPYQF